MVYMLLLSCMLVKIGPNSKGSTVKAHLINKTFILMMQSMCSWEDWVV